jgi:glutamate N-acetyltransferase/amino-acid N-acetyltransferase
MVSVRYGWTFAVQRRWQSTLTYTSRPLPSKTHLHASIPDSSFPLGYSVTGLHCGVKKTQVPDLGLILSTSPHPTSAAACFTRNAFKAAPVLVCQDVLAARNGRARALVVNSGCANAVTGAGGLEDAWNMARETDQLLSNCPAKDTASETLVMSTGVIGQRLPISRILDAIKTERHSSTGGSNFAAWERAARAFMTTDTFPKLRARTFSINGRTYRIAGIDKGAGMIHPDMGPAAPPRVPHATLLGCIVTDAPISPRSLQNALTYAVDRSFNSISVDGEMSTNDTVLLLANGAAHGKEEQVIEIDEATDKEAYLAFRNELTDFAADLAQLVVRDGEGATKFVTITVKVCLSALHYIIGRSFRFRRVQHLIQMLTKSHHESQHLHWSRPPCTERMRSKYPHYTRVLYRADIYVAGAASSLQPVRSQ